MASVINGSDNFNSAAGAALKAWVNFSGPTAAIRASYGVSSVTRNGAGDYTINFSTAFADSNYAVAGYARANTGGGTGPWLGVVTGHNSVAPTTTSIRIVPGYAANSGWVGVGGVDYADYISLAFYR